MGITGMMRQEAESTGCGTGLKAAGRHLTSPNGICLGISEIFSNQKPLHGYPDLMFMKFFLKKKPLNSPRPLSSTILGQLWLEAFQFFEGCLGSWREMPAAGSAPMLLSGKATPRSPKVYESHAWSVLIDFWFC